MKKYINNILLSSLLCCCSSNEDKKIKSCDFSIRWGVLGCHFYNSTNNKLIKYIDEPEVDNYSTSLILSNDVEKKIIEYFNKIKIYSYPKHPKILYLDFSVCQQPGLFFSLEFPEYKIETDNSIIDNYMDNINSLPKKQQDFLLCMNYITSYIENTPEYKSITTSPTVFYM